MTTTKKAKQEPKTNDRCPNCGYCPHCGKSNAAPVYPSYPSYPVQRRLPLRR